MIYALLTRNFVVRIYALFPQIILDWKAKSADIFTFWMYDDEDDFNLGFFLSPFPISFRKNLEIIAHISIFALQKNATKYFLAEISFPNSTID